MKSICATMAASVLACSMGGCAAGVVYQANQTSPEAETCSDGATDGWISQARSDLSMTHQFRCKPDDPKHDPCLPYLRSAAENFMKAGQTKESRCRLIVLRKAAELYISLREWTDAQKAADGLVADPEAGPETQATASNLRTAIASGQQHGASTPAERQKQNGRADATTAPSNPTDGTKAEAEKVPPRVHWSFPGGLDELGSRGDYAGRPAIGADGTIYLASGHGRDIRTGGSAQAWVIALDPDGNLKQKTELPSFAGFSEPLVAGQDGVVYAQYRRTNYGDPDGEAIVAIRDGKILWQRYFKSTGAIVLLADSLVLSVHGGGMTVPVAASPSKREKTKHGKGKELSTQPAAKADVNPEQHSILSLGLDGNPRWQTPLSITWASIIGDKQDRIIARAGNIVAAVASTDGKVLWGKQLQYNIGGFIVGKTGEVLLTIGPKLYVLDPKTGDVVKKIGADHPDRATDRIYAGEGGAVYGYIDMPGNMVHQDGTSVEVIRIFDPDAGTFGDYDTPSLHADDIVLYEDKHYVLMRPAQSSGRTFGDFGSVDGHKAASQLICKAEVGRRSLMFGRNEIAKDSPVLLTANPNGDTIWSCDADKSTVWGLSGIGGIPVTDGWGQDNHDAQNSNSASHVVAVTHGPAGPTDGGAAGGGAPIGMAAFTLTGEKVANSAGSESLPSINPGYGSVAGFASDRDGVRAMLVSLGFNCTDEEPSLVGDVSASCAGVPKYRATTIYMRGPPETHALSRLEVILPASGSADLRSSVFGLAGLLLDKARGTTSGENAHKAIESAYAHLNCGSNEECSAQVSLGGLPASLKKTSMGCCLLLVGKEADAP